MTNSDIFTIICCEAMRKRVFVIILSIFALTPAHSRSLLLTPAHSRSLPLTPARADAQTSTGEGQILEKVR